METLQNNKVLPMDLPRWICVLILALLLVPSSSFATRDNPCIGCSVTSTSTNCNPIYGGSIILSNLTCTPKYVCVGGQITANFTKLIIKGTNVVTANYTDSCGNTCQDPVLTANSITPGNFVTWTASIGAWSTNGTTIPAKFNPPVCGSGTITFHATWTNTCDGSVASSDFSTNFISFQLLSVGVTSGATQIGTTTNWVAVKTNSTTDFVTVSAVLCPNDPNGASLLTWSGGQAVPGNPLARQVPRNVSAKTIVTASCCNTSYTAAVWIIWGTVSYNFVSVLNTDNNLSFANFGNAGSPINHFPNPRNAGPVIGASTFTLNGMTFSVLGANTKVEIIGTLSPSGIGKLFSTASPFSMNPQRRIYYIWSTDGTFNGHQLPSVTSSTAGTPHGPDDDTPLPQQTTPVNDKIFALDAPGPLELYPPSVTGYEGLAANFTNYIKMGSTIISDPKTWNSHVKETFSGSSNTALPCSASSGNPTLPTTWGSSSW
jgi:hypothetical protein